MDTEVSRPQTTGEQIVDAIADGSVDRLQAAVNDLSPEELGQLYADINKANNARAEKGELPVVVIIEDADGDGHVDVSGTSKETGLTIAVEGEDEWTLKAPGVILGAEAGTQPGSQPEVPKGN